MIIEVPAPLVSLTPYVIIGGKKDGLFNKYIEDHPYVEKRKEAGFVGKVNVEKGRLASLLVFPLEEVRYDLVFEEGEIKYNPKSLRYVNKVVVIYNEDGVFEIVGMNSRNRGIIRNILEKLSEELNIDIRHHQVLTPESIEYILKFQKKDDLNISRLAYNLEEKGEKIKRYEYASDLTHRLIELGKDHSDILSIAGYTAMAGTKMSFNIRKDGNVTIYNMVKKPLIWNNVFRFLDKIIYMK
jgi:hypothetical protein